MMMTMMMTTMTMMNNNNEKKECKKITNKCIEVNTPVKLETIVDIEDISVKSNEPQIICNSKKKCHNNYICEFVIKQTLLVEIPICYQTDADAGDSFVKCSKPKHQ